MKNRIKRLLVLGVLTTFLTCGYRSVTVYAEISPQERASIDEQNAAVEEIAAAASASASDTSVSNNIEREIVNVETEEVSGVSTEQVDEKGYHIDKNEDGSFTIVVTGGLDEIEIDFTWFSGTELMYPGDKINASFSIVNESGDKYEITGYEKKTDGPYRYSLSTSFNEDWGTPVETFTDSRGHECTAYIPNEILKVNGRDIDKSTLEIMYKNYPNKTIWERRELAKNLTEEELLAYYNEQMGTEYQDTFEAWKANLNERLWTTTYTKDGEEEQYGEDFWKSIDLTTNTPVDFTMTANLDGLGTDNLYQMTVWDFIEVLKLKAIPNIKVTDPLIEPDNPTPTPTPSIVEIVDTPTPLASQVLGESPQTRDDSLGRMIKIVAMSFLVGIILTIIVLFLTGIISLIYHITNPRK